jgi:acyl transferase domain-containing protein/acyl carrier protein
MLSPEGRCRFGDAHADGFVRSEGVGAVVLKRLDDALRDGDPVLAVLRGSAVTNDGRASGLLLRPSVQGQADMVREACRSAGITPSELDYVEAHGTGTSVGDGVELRALAESGGAGRPADRPLLTGSVKTNLGHAEAAAGLAGLIKAVLIVRHGMLPASLHLDTPHSLLTQDDFPVRVVTRNQPLHAAGTGALLGISSFGLSGTNAHAVIGAHVPDPVPDTRGTASDTEPHLLVLSARTPGALRRLAEKYASYLGRSGPGRRHRLSDICSAAATGRDAHPHRLWIVGDDHDTLSRRLRALAAGETIPYGGIGEAELPGERRTVFVFSGQGSQWAGMSRTLYRTSAAFRAAMDACDRAVRKELDWSVLERLESVETEFPTDVSIVQPVLWAVQVALTAAWRERGVEPDLCIGHSMGEIAAAHASGVLSLDDAAAVICRRSRLMRRTAGQGAMLVVELSAEEARQNIRPHGAAVCVAAENAPTATVLAGTPTALGVLRTELEERGILCRPVQVNLASHSPQMDALRDDLLRELPDLSPAPRTVDMISTVHGSKVKGPEMTAVYWMDNLRRPVRFADTVLDAARETESIFLEVSPHPVLVSAMADTLSTDRDRAATVASLHRGQDERAELARAAGRIFACGGRVDWTRWYGSGPRHVPSLPTYAWDAVQFRRDPADHGSAHRSTGARVRSLDLAAWGGTADWGDGVAVHRVAPVPPVVYLAAMLETAQETDRDAAFELRDVALGETPVPVDAAADTVLQVSLDGQEAQGRARTVTVQASLRGAPAPVLCASGQLVRADTERADSASGILDGALARCREYCGAQDFQRLAQRHGLDIAEPFRAVQHLWRRDGEAVARVRLPNPLPKAGWEAALQPLLAARPGAMSDAAGSVYIPVAFGSVRFHAEPVPEFWSLSTVRPGSDGQSAEADVLLIAPNGRVLAQFSGIRMRRLARTISPHRPLRHIPALMARLTEQCAAPLTSLVKKAAGPAVGAFLSNALRVVPEHGPGLAGTVVPPPSPKETPHPARPRRTVAAQMLLEHSATLLGMPATEIDERRSLRDLGLDSLMAAQLRQLLHRSHGIEITAGRLLGPESLASLGKSLAERDAPPASDATGN